VDEDSGRKRGAWAGQLGGLVVIVALILWFVQMRKAPTNLLQRRDCERAYEAARTASDTASVDQRRPVLGQSTDTLTCGTFRRAGRLP
jgi:hypothetical protein